MSNDGAAKEVLGFAKNRLNKFYNPKLYKAGHINKHMLQIIWSFMFVVYVVYKLVHMCITLIYHAIKSLPLGGNILVDLRSKGT